MTDENPGDVREQRLARIEVATVKCSGLSWGDILWLVGDVSRVLDECVLTSNARHFLSAALAGVGASGPTSNTDAPNLEAPGRDPGVAALVPVDPEYDPALVEQTAKSLYDRVWLGHAPIPWDGMPEQDWYRSDAIAVLNDIMPLISGAPAGLSKLPDETGETQ